MIKYSFKNDYSELAHPRIIQALADFGSAQFQGYGMDTQCEQAADLIKQKISAPHADVHFISGGTQANLTVIGSILRPHEAVISVRGGHIEVHECGAIEATGHKVCYATGIDGKVTVPEIDEIVKQHCDEHMVKPKLVYISDSTEIGSIWGKAELAALSTYCRETGLYLYLDGARLPMALNSKKNDLAYSDIAKLVDVFYLGGTKCGALFGEAIVICNDALKSDFRYHMKQRGAMLAKGAALGVQFTELFKDGLYDELAKHATAMAKKLGNGMQNLGINFASEPVTNQIFPIMQTEIIDTLHEHYEFFDNFGNPAADMKVCRFCTSWATEENVIDEFLKGII
jgi:threonine aldolase